MLVALALALRRKCECLGFRHAGHSDFNSFSKAFRSLRKMMKLLVLTPLVVAATKPGYYARLGHLESFIGVNMS